MVSSDVLDLSICPACAGPTRASALCRECYEAFALARGAHPTAGASPAVPGVEGRHEPTVGDDLDLWDAWSLLGDVGGRSQRADLD